MTSNDWVTSGRCRATCKKSGTNDTYMPDVTTEIEAMSAKMQSPKPPATAADLMAEVRAKQGRPTKLQTQIQAKDFFAVAFFEPSIKQERDKAQNLQQRAKSLHGGAAAVEMR